MVSKIITRFPPEPNGYLHFGHAKSICLNFGLAKKFSGTCNLRLDDTNPEKENKEFVSSIIESVEWLGFDATTNLYYASDYFDFFYEAARLLIKNNLAYVDSQNAEEIKSNRGTLKQPGKNSKFREREITESLELFEKMKLGEFEPGKHVLRAKIDMRSPNINLRDPILYKIRFTTHHRQGNTWCIYPLYDFAHPLSDAIEKVSHSICTLEFEDHRPMYDWVVQSAKKTGLFKNQTLPRQFEFAKLNIENLILSKRKLSEIVDKKIVSGWDDPRMPTLDGAKKRGYVPEGFIKFNHLIGVTKASSNIDFSLLEECMRGVLNDNVDRKISVFDPLELIVENLEEDISEQCFVPNHPKYFDRGKREITFGKRLLIERSDFQVNPQKKFFRLTPGSRVRLKYAYVVECTGYELKDGVVSSVKVKMLKDSKSGTENSDNYKVKGNIHWLNKKNAVPCEVVVFEDLFENKYGNDERKKQSEELFINTKSKTVLKTFVEPSAVDAPNGSKFQFERHGYFILNKDEKNDSCSFGKIIALKDTWKKC